MPIEDINYLYAHGNKENKIIFLDSSMRDRLAWPHPSEYAIDFTEPFHNVYSVDVLDAAIPRTMYNVDTYSNTISLGVGPTALTADMKLTLTIRDYNMDSLMAELTAKMTNLKGLFTITATSAGDGTARMSFTSSVPFMFDMKNSTLSESIGFTELATTTETTRYVKIPDDTTSDLTVANNQKFGSVSVPALPTVMNYGLLYSSAAAAATAANYYRVDAATYVAQKISVSEYCFLHNLRVQLVQVGAASSTADLRWALVYGDSSGNNKPSLSAADVVRSGKLSLNRTTMIASSEVLSNEDFNLVHLNQLSEHWVVIYDAGGGSADGADYLAVAYNGTYGSLGDPGSATRANGGAWISTGFTSSVAFCIEVETITKSFTISSPGVISLVGERFVTLRCPEVEQYIYGSVAFGRNSPGLALFKLGVVGYSDSRFDFSSIAYKEFHPIGKLSKLTFRYERISGDVYDFKGVNHHMLIVIRYLTATKPLDFTRFSLNPHYTPNYMQYLRGMEEKEGDPEDDAEIDEYSFRNEYLKKEQAYDFDESGEIDYLPELDDSAREKWERELGR